MNNKNDSDKEYETESKGEAQSWEDAAVGDVSATDTSEQFYATSGGSHNHTAMILMAICVASMFAVYYFGMKQKPKEASAEEKAVEAQLDSALARLVNEPKKNNAGQLFKETGEMVQAFYEYPANQQVSLEDLSKNPFERMIAGAENDGENEKAKSKLQLEKELRRKFDQLELQSILHSSSGSKCLINGEIFVQGQQVMDAFEVKEIKAGHVVLTSEEQEFILEM